MVLRCKLATYSQSILLPLDLKLLIYLNISIIPLM